MSAPFPDPRDQRFLVPEWDMLFGLMVGRLLANGYTPAQIQAKTRSVADAINCAVNSEEGKAAGEDVRQGMDVLIDLFGGVERGAPGSCMWCGKPSIPGQSTCGTCEAYTQEE